MTLTFNSPPDEGLLAAFELTNLDTAGIACEFGTGTARNLRACARRGYTSVGYELADWAVEAARTKIAEEGLTATILQQDVVGLVLEPNSLSVAILGTAIYWPKSQVYKFLDQLNAAIRLNGILHLEFATPADCSYTSDFFLAYCAPLKEAGYTNSFFHYCGYNCSLDHPGVIGSSFWTYADVSHVVAHMGPWKFVHRHLDQWLQVTEDATEGEGLFRSFERVTLQKLR